MLNFIIISWVKYDFGPSTLELHGFSYFN